MNKILFGLIVWPFIAFAEEPGHMQAETPPSEMPSVSLGQEFAKARGLKDFEMSGLHYNRVACARNTFSSSGRSIEGDGDLKVTEINPDYVQAEFPSTINFVNYGGINPFRNGIAYIDSAAVRQLVRTRDWVDGQSLKLYKSVTLTFEKEIPPQTVPAMAEIRVIDKMYPKTFLIRETILAEKPFNVYYFCQ